MTSVNWHDGLDERDLAQLVACVDGGGRVDARINPLTSRFVAALCRNDELQDGGRGNGGGHVNYSVSTYWNDEIPPDDVLSTLTSWHRSGLYVNHYSKSSAEALLRRMLGGEVSRAFAYAHHPAMEADIFRMGLLYAVGRLYVDADDGYLGSENCNLNVFGAGVVAPPLAYHARKKRGITVSDALNNLDEDTRVYFNSTPLFSTPRHRLIEIALENIVRAMYYRRSRGELFQHHNDVGPGCLTISVLQYAVEALKNGSAFDFKFRVHWPSVDLFRPLAYKKTERNWRSATGRIEHAVNTC